MNPIQLPASHPTPPIGQEFREDYFEWEERDHSVPFRLHMIAGSVAGLAEHVVLLPIDIIKTHKQVSTKYISSTDVVTNLRKSSGGMRNFWKGASVMSLGSAPAHALFFSMYELLNHHLILKDNSEYHIPKHALIGIICSFFHDLIIVPCEAVKQRCQISNLKPSEVAREMLRKEGVKSFWRSFPVTFLMNFPYQAAVFATNESLKTLFAKHKVTHSFWTHFFCASLAGLAACFLTMPLDVLKTHLNTSKFITADLQFRTPNAGNLPSSKSWSRLLSGFGPRVLTQTLAVGASWSVYGAMKNLLQGTHRH